ncbi:cellulose synthase complex periplasmic endoglucanase BcsZ [Solimonas soli]|uniref:cellulose synthase complex periplasmic endoglucanase BcsZ n=1 Tax=Solimonas soli TaxID=413479 RepID=UPI000485313A|nr:cellulose synthase complex periplasmic endoglucanase BcsZ [Solimonas soli]
MFEMPALHAAPRRPGVAVFALAWLGALLCATSACHAQPPWPDWQAFADRFVQADGRVVDLTFERKSTSEGQSYGLFFALVGNDRARFDAILDWTSQNLAGGELGARLPGWCWGRLDDGRWGLKDSNAAADADLWIAYDLLEAARLWKAPAYAVTARALLARIAAQEVVETGEAGPLLLPAPVGFALGDGRWRIDPSYLPNPLFRYLATVEPDGPWRRVWEAYVRLWPQIYASGIAPDLVLVDRQGRVSADAQRPTASYDAIRVYLWAAMAGEDGAELVRRLKPFAELIRAAGAPPEEVETASGRAVPKAWSPIGFMGASLPFLDALGERELLARVRARLQLERGKARLGRSSNYYDEALVLFGLGWLEGRYRFDAEGRLQPAWAAPATP